MSGLKKIVMAFYISFLMMACQQLPIFSGNAESVTPSRGNYYEDLSATRPEFISEPSDSIPEKITLERRGNSAEFSQEDTQSLAILTDSIASLQLKKNKVDGYSILVHSGTKNEDALKVKGYLIKNFPEEPSELFFQQPFFKVRIGNYVNQLSASELLLKVRKDYPGAIIVPTQFQVVEKKKE